MSSLLNFINIIRGKNMQKQNEENIPEVKKEGWDAEKLVEEGANEESDDVVRKILRGNEEDGNADKRDIIPAFNSEDDLSENKNQS